MAAKAREGKTHGYCTVYYGIIRLTFIINTCILMQLYYSTNNSAAPLWKAKEKLNPTIKESIWVVPSSYIIKMLCSIVMLLSGL